ncbi:hypothetical protein HWI79_3613 [Cryptosporidium felis]|nr:hypothetical protein HWI79_3613 [Cryptosporidium felis]
MISALKDPKRKDRENSYINKETFPTLDLSIEGIEESIYKVWCECQQGQELLKEIDHVLSLLYSKISVISSPSNGRFSIEEICEMDSLVKENEANRNLIYETFTRKLALKHELELLRQDLINKKSREAGQEQRDSHGGPNSDWNVLLEELEHRSDSDSSSGHNSMFLDLSVSGSHSTDFEYVQEDFLI